MKTCTLCGKRTRKLTAVNDGGPQHYCGLCYRGYVESQAETPGRKTLPERIREWVEREFNPKHIDRVTQDLIDVASGNRDGNRFEVAALARIFPELSKE